MTTEFAETMQTPAEPSPERDRRALVMLLRQYQSIEREQVEQCAWMDAITAVYREDTDRRSMTLASLTEAIEELAKDLRLEGSQHVDVPGIARLQFTTTKPYLRVADPDAMVEWARAHEEFGLLEFVPASVKPVTNAAKALAEKTLAESGEVLPWAEQVPAVTTMKITSRSER